MGHVAAGVESYRPVSGLMGRRLATSTPRVACWHNGSFDERINVEPEPEQQQADQAGHDQSVCPVLFIVSSQRYQGSDASADEWLKQQPQPNQNTERDDDQPDSPHDGCLSAFGRQPLRISLLSSGLIMWRRLSLDRFIRRPFDPGAIEILFAHGITSSVTISLPSCSSAVTATTLPPARLTM